MASLPAPSDDRFLLADALARAVAIREALEDGHLDYAAAIAERLDLDLAAMNGAAEREGCRLTFGVLTGIAIEGAADYFFGRPLDANPYSRESLEDGWESWRYGWLEAAWFEGTRGDEERSRWWRRAA